MGACLLRSNSPPPSPSLVLNHLGSAFYQRVNTATGILKRVERGFDALSVAPAGTCRFLQLPSPFVIVLRCCCAAALIRHMTPPGPSIEGGNLVNFHISQAQLSHYCYPMMPRSPLFFPFFLFPFSPPLFPVPCKFPRFLFLLLFCLSQSASYISVLILNSRKCSRLPTLSNHSRSLCGCVYTGFI